MRSTEAIRSHSGAYKDACIRHVLFVFLVFGLLLIPVLCVCLFVRTDIALACRLSRGRETSQLCWEATAAAAAPLPMLTPVVMI